MLTALCRFDHETKITGSNIVIAVTKTAAATKMPSPIWRRKIPADLVGSCGNRVMNTSSANSGKSENAAIVNVATAPKSGSGRNENSAVVGNVVTDPHP